MHFNLAKFLLASVILPSVWAAPIPLGDAPLKEGVQHLQPRQRKPTTLKALVIGGILSGLALVLTKKIWENWNIKHMDPSVLPLPVNLQPDPRQATRDQIAVANALKRITISAQGREVQASSVSTEVQTILDSLTPQQKEVLANVFKASAHQDTPEAAVGIQTSSMDSIGALPTLTLTTQPTPASGKRLEKRLSYIQAGASGLLSGVGFAIGGLALQQWINNRFGPKSTLR
ncbi:hypothetical protein FRB95_004581 [Tulasnella sp. JGI-2019a]|nr:hypothetical protein FRB95_004581 [Tulasnella sp. JGI-2019a]